MSAIRIYLIFFQAYIKKLMEYKADFIMGALSFLLNQFTSILFISILFEGITDLNNWSFYEIVLLYGFSLIPKGIDHFFTDNLWNFSSNIVKNGTFDRYLLRPISPLYQVVIETVQFDSLGECITGIFAIVIACNKLKYDLSVFKILLLFVFAILGSVIYTCIKIVCASLAFWKVKSGNILKVVYMMSDFNKYPISIYHIFIRNLLTYCIPFAFTAYYPIMYVLGRADFAHTFIPCVFVVCIMVVIASFTWTCGVNSYESAGH